MNDSVTDTVNTDGGDIAGDEKPVQTVWPSTPSARRKARRFTLQALYSWHVGGEPPHAVEAYYRAENDMRKTDVVYFHELFNGVIARADDLDAAFANFLDRPVRDLDPVERAILRMATFELLSRVDVPPRVAINEGIELAKEFGATDDSHKFVNGVLDKVGRKVRASEFAARE
jgi:N utilization substance protein B